MKTIAIIMCLLFSLFNPVYASHKYLEKDYQKYWCNQNNGNTEVKLPDYTRIDCLTKDYAIEFDFANKWAEAIGQSLYYSLSINKKPGIVLILEDSNKDLKYLNRLINVANKYCIRVWTITPLDIENSRFCTNCSN